MNHPLPSGKLTVSLAVTLKALFLSSGLSAEVLQLRLTLTGHTEEVRCVVISPDGNTLASASGDHTIRFWDVATGKEQDSLRRTEVHGVEKLAFSPDAKSLVSGSVGNSVKMWDVATRKETILFESRKQAGPPLVVFSPDGKTLATGGRCISEMKLWDVASGKNTATLKGFDAYGVRAMSFSRDGKTLAAVGYHDGIKLWDVATAMKTATQKTKIKYVPCAAFSPDSNIAAMAIGDLIVEEGGRNVVRETGGIKLWDVAVGKERGTLSGHTGQVCSMVFSPDGRILASGSEENTIKLWEVATNEELGTLRGHADKISSLAFSADGRMLVSGSEDRTIKLWDVTKSK